MSAIPFKSAVTVDTTQFAVKLGNLRRLTPEGMKIALGQSAGRIGVRLARLTYPKTFESGQGAVKRDLSAKVFRPFGAILKDAMRGGKRWIAPAATKAVARGDRKAVEAIFQIAGMQVKLANRPDMARRNALKSGTSSVVKRGTDDVLIMDRSKVAALAERIAKQQVGNAAAGWLAASRTLRKPRSSDYVPDFKKRLSRRNTGLSFFAGSGERTTATIRNRVRYISRPFNAGMVQIAKAGEAQTIAKQMRVLVRKGYAKRAEIKDMGDIFAA